MFGDLKISIPLGALLKNTALNMQLLLKDKTSLKTKIMKNNTQFFWSEERFTRPIVRSRLLMSSWM